MKELSKQDQDFVKGVALTGNKTQSAKDAYGIENDGYARVKGHKQITKDNIATALEEVKRTIAEQIPDDLLIKVHLEGLNAGRTIIKGDNEIVEPDYATRHKYLDTAHKLKGTYAPDKSIVLDIQADITNPDAQRLAQEYELKLKENL